jgi:hypothetical protein
VDWFRLIYAVLIVGVVGGLWVWRLRGHARRGGAFDWTRNRFARLEVTGDADKARKLVYDGLLQALGTRTPRRKSHGNDFKVVSHLDPYGAGSQWFRFQLQPLDDGRTQLVISSLPGGMAGGDAPPDPDYTAARLAQLDQFAAWLGEHGEGRVLETDWGKPH